MYVFICTNCNDKMCKSKVTYNNMKKKTNEINYILFNNSVKQLMKCSLKLSS